VGVAFTLPFKLTSADYLAGVLTGLGVAGLFTLAWKLVDGGRKPPRRRRP
jgi:hypothetical protein